MAKQNEIIVGKCAYIHSDATKGGGEIGLVIGWAAPYEDRIYIYDGRYLQLSSRCSHRVIVLYVDGMGFVGIEQPYVLALSGKTLETAEATYGQLREVIQQELEKNLVSPAKNKPMDPESIKAFGVLVLGIVVLCGFSQSKRVSSRRVDDEYSWMDHATGHSLLDWIVKKAVKA